MTEPPTRPYRPSNGSEGEAFENAFCLRCKKYGDPDGVGTCDILCAAMSRLEDHPNYPKEWVEDDTDTPPWNERCTAFEAAS